MDRNHPPETVLTGVPGDSTTTFYRIHLFWNGFDGDGKVVGYEWSITDSLPPVDEIAWRYTTRTDSIFVFRVEETREILGHRFYLRAVDNEGKRDATPAFTFFAVRDNCVPTTWFTVAEAFGPNGEVRTITSTNTSIPTDTIPSGWGVRFRWLGADCDRAITPEGRVETVGRVSGYDSKLGPVEFNWIRGTTDDTTAVYDASRLRSDLFEMRVRARDDAGLTGLDPALRTFVWNYDPVTRFTRDLVPSHPDSVPVFYASTTGSTGEYTAYSEGDTLPLTAAGVSVRANVRAVDPDSPFRILAVQARLVKDAAFWVDLPASLLFQAERPVYTGDYRMMARSLDGRDRWDGTPAEIRFTVNRVALFRDHWTYYGQPVTQRPMEGATYAATGRDTLRIRFAAFDPDFAPGITSGVEFIYRWESYPLPGGGQGTETLFPSSWINGEYTPEVVILNRAAKLPDPTPNDPGPTFLPGEYILHVRAREQYGSSEDRDTYGFQPADRFVRFRLAE